MRTSESHAYRLETPPIPCVVPADLAPAVFDAYGWCASDWLEWRRPARADGGGAPIEEAPCLDGSDPSRMVFVFRGDAAACPFLPRELARLHATGLGLEDEDALAPWGIDAATDELYARRIRPRDVLWLAADNANALFWGLHDWAHFHNHGPFAQRAWTELQCDASALAWLWANRNVVGLSPRAWDGLRAQALELSVRRFEEEKIAFETRRGGSALSADRLKAFVD